MLAKVLSTRADLEGELGHWQAAADFEEAALRLGYARPETRSLAISHHNLAAYLGVAGRGQGGAAGAPAGRRAAVPADRHDP